MDKNETPGNEKSSTLPLFLNSVGAYLLKHAENAARYYREIARGVSKPQEAVKLVPPPLSEDKKPAAAGKEPGHE